VQSIPHEHEVGRKDFLFLIRSPPLGSGWIPESSSMDGFPDAWKSLRVIVPFLPDSLAPVHPC